MNLFSNCQLHALLLTLMKGEQGIYSKENRRNFSLLIE